MAHHPFCAPKIAGVWTCVFGCTEDHFTAPARDVEFELSEMTQQYAVVHEDLVKLSRLALDYCDKSVDLMLSGDAHATMDLRRRVRDIADRWIPCDDKMKEDS